MAGAFEAVDIDNCGAVHANKFRRIESRFNGFDRFPDEVRPSPGVERDVVPLCVNPVDVFRADELDLPA